MMEADSIRITEDTPYHYRQREGSIVKEVHELGREQFVGLYRVLGNAFANNELLMEQLKYYMFFVLLLKAYSQLADKMPLFPFLRVHKGSRILVYGAGGFGRIVEQFVRNAADLELAGWADQNAGYYRQRGQNVIFPNEITSIQFDYLVIAILNENLAEKIRDELTGIGVKAEKIDFVQKKVLKGQTLPDWLDKTI
jgi:hypothetical protein